MRFTSQTISGIILIAVGVGQFFGAFTYPLWLNVLCVGIMFLTER
jgi:hypothetical protein